MSRSLFSTMCVLGLIVVGASAVNAQETLPKVLNGGIVNGKAVSLPKPVYPEAAKAAKVEGRVVVEVVIGEDGTVESAAALLQPEKYAKPGGEPNEFEEIQPVDPMLRQAAENAALQAKFPPTMINGQSVKVRGKIVYNFSLNVNRFTMYTTANRPMSADVSGGVLNSKARSLPLPAYPEAAKVVNARGTVTVEVVVDEDGSIIYAAAVSGHPLLRAASVQAARQATFAPTRLDGKPVKVSGVLVYNFVP